MPLICILGSPRARPPFPARPGAAERRPNSRIVTPKHIYIYIYAMLSYNLIYYTTLIYTITCYAMLLHIVQ